VAAGATDIAELIAMLSICGAFAGNDSGAMHLAGALGIPTVGIFGSTNPYRTGPLGPRAQFIWNKIDCAPCLARTCRFGHYNCLTGIAVDDVAARIGPPGGSPT
jgi:ADP-heptose:LPS heptosyltransferase